MSPIRKVHGTLIELVVTFPLLAAAYLRLASAGAQQLQCAIKQSNEI